MNGKKGEKDKVKVYTSLFIIIFYEIWMFFFYHTLVSRSDNCDFIAHRKHPYEQLIWWHCIKGTKLKHVLKGQQVHTCYRLPAHTWKLNKTCKVSITVGFNMHGSDSPIDAVDQELWFGQRTKSLAPIWWHTSWLLLHHYSNHQSATALTLGLRPEYSGGGVKFSRAILYYLALSWIILTYVWFQNRF